MTRPYLSTSYGHQWGIGASRGMALKAPLAPSPRRRKEVVKSASCPESRSKEAAGPETSMDVALA